MESAREPAVPAHDHDEDAAQLAALGYDYDTTFKREMTFWGNVSLGFTYLSPVVAVYSMFAIALGQGGPPMYWALLIAGVGQFFVSLIFGEVVSNYPVAGGVYPWARRLWGRKWAWMNGWVYIVAMFATIASVSYGAGPFLGSLFDAEAGITTTVVCALVMMFIATVLNLSGTGILNSAAKIGLVCELAGALVVGAWLLLTAREHDWTVLFDTFGAGSGQHYFVAFSAAALIGIFQYYGFEACGDVAEEIKNPGLQIPKAMRWTIYIGGFAAMFVAFALILAVPDYVAVIEDFNAGSTNDPLTAVLSSAFGPVGYKFVIAVVLVSFLSCLISLQAAVSRLTYSMSRDGILPFSRQLVKVNARTGVPSNALILAAVIPGAIVVISILLPDALATIISFSSVGIYIAFQMVVLAALRARLLGWKPAGSFRLGSWAYLVNVLALAWGVLGILALAWPRSPESPWYVNFIVALSAVGVLGFGGLYMWVKKPYLVGDAPSGDATGPIRTSDLVGAGTQK
ncbi:APC family permease [Glaciibacter psychrotolerans]|uniref:Amino acid transporter n=1 Tax=Glaciibacter psychrotolerans TaxID=670054 RepID=A0A7Z0EHN7_9MICO|nr:APC family permease [Leifsonia psychrotolerans]NYJ21107.1 amino acid transporter [Leifsonia psychrotolerans]